jgi:acyl-coenzyme A thioesterase PaaI-like protein
MVCARFRANRSLQGYSGILHGGMIAALLDAAMTHCLFRRSIQAVTADLHVRFLHPIHCGALVDLRGWMTAERPRLYRLKAELVLKQQVMAWAEATFMRR